MLQEHLEYLSDPVRLNAYRAAISTVVTNGMRVADLGCGTGVLGLLCLQAGASRVYAIDSSAMIGVARESLSRAGYGQQAEFFHGQSSWAQLPERVDLVVCDQMGYFGFDYGIVGQYQDAKVRFLKPGGILMPARISLHMAAVESVECHRLAQAWAAEPVPPDFHWLRQRATHAKHAVELKADLLISSTAELGTIELGNDGPPFFSWSADVRVTRDGCVHGLGGWFGCELAEGVGMTNSPLAKQPIRRCQAFLPLDEPVRVRKGEQIVARIMARPEDDLLAWVVEFPATGRRFRHSTWNGCNLSPQDLARASEKTRPRPNATGRARSTVLSYCDGERSAREIERVVLERHPELLPSRTEISRFVAQTIARDCEP